MYSRCSSLLCALLSERCQCQRQCRRVGYGALGQKVAYIARACYMTKTDGVCLSCCPSASTPAVARLLVRYWQGSAAVGSPSSVRTGTRAVGSSGGVVERSSSGVRIDSKNRMREVGVDYQASGPEFMVRKSVPRKGFQDASVPSMLREPWT